MDEPRSRYRSIRLAGGYPTVVQALAAAEKELVSSEPTDLIPITDMKMGRVVGVAVRDETGIHSAAWE